MEQAAQQPPKPQPISVTAAIQAFVADQSARKFPDWRSGSEEQLRDWLDTPRQGIFFDIERNDFWLPEWGPNPKVLQDALQFADRLLVAAPKLIPICQHRMIPNDPHLRETPFSQCIRRTSSTTATISRTTCVIEFRLAGRKPWRENLRPIRFWDIDRFLEVRWANGPCVFDNRRGILPEH